MSETWYSEGLRFTCTRCGNCCTGEPGNVWVNGPEMAAIARYRKEPESETRAMYTKQVGRRLSLREKDNGDCVFFEREQGCTIYAVRPRQCRTWPFWESNVVTETAWARTCQTCPGSGQGELISPEEIARRIRVISL